MAAKRGNLIMLKWARAKGAPWNVKVCTKAAREGNLEVLKWAKANGCPWDQAKVVRKATSGRQVDVVKWVEGE